MVRRRSRNGRNEHSPLVIRRRVIVGPQRFALLVASSGRRERRSKCGKGNKVEQRVSQANLLVGTHGHSPYLHSAAVAFEKQPAGQFFFLDMAWPEEVG